MDSTSSAVSAHHVLVHVGNRRDHANIKVAVMLFELIQLTNRIHRLLKSVLDFANTVVNIVNAIK